MTRKYAEADSRRKFAYRNSASKKGNRNEERRKKAEQRIDDQAEIE